MELNKIEKAIRDRTIKLPPVPSIAARVTSLCQSDDVSINDIANVIRFDPALSIRILQVANSAFFGFSKSDNLDQALSKLGLNLIKNLVYSFTIKDALHTHNKHLLQLFNAEWIANIRLAVFSSIIATYINYRKVDSVFLGSILHKIGLLPLYNNINDDEVELLYSNNYISLVKDASIIIITRWELPSEFVDVVVKYDHYSSLSNDELATPATIIGIAYYFFKIKYGYITPDSFFDITVNGCLLTHSILDELYDQRLDEIEGLIRSLS